MQLDAHVGGDCAERTDYLYLEGSPGRIRVGAAGNDRTYRFDSASAFTEITATVSPLFKPTLDLRYGRFIGGCDKRVETGDDLCGALNTTSRATPKLGFRSALVTGLDLRANLAEGFALPPDVAEYGSGGAGLKPTVPRQRELGANVKGVMFAAEVFVYRITSSNEVREISPAVFENFGRTQRDGLEAALTLMSASDVEPGMLFNAAAARVTVNADATLVGK